MAKKRKQQRIFLVLAIVGNVLMILLPCVAIVGLVWSERRVLGDPFVFLLLLVTNIALIPLIAVAGGNLLCMRDALTQWGQSRTTAIARGKTLCVAMAVVGLLLSICLYFPFPLLVIGTVALVTNKVFSDVLAELKRRFFCPRCNYDLVGLLGADGDRGNGACPECGLHVKPEPGT